MSESLDALAAQAAALDNEANANAEAGPQQDQEQAGPQVDYATAAAGILNMAAAALAPMYPFVPKHYTPEANALIAQSWVQLAQAYDVDLSKLLGKVALWAQAIAATGMPAMGIVAELRRQEAERARQAERDAAIDAPQ